MSKSFVENNSPLARKVLAYSPFWREVPPLNERPKVEVRRSSDVKAVHYWAAGRYGRLDFDPPVLLNTAAYIAQQLGA